MNEGRETTEVVHGHGHENVSAEHASTLELTSDDFLTPAGDCILSPSRPTASPQSSTTCSSRACQDADATITLTIEAGGESETVTGSGHPDLTFDGDRSFVCRTSDYVDDRTVMVEADGAAADLDRGLVDALADGADVTATFSVE